jgi:hypothetical protein
MGCGIRYDPVDWSILLQSVRSQVATNCSRVHVQVLDSRLLPERPPGRISTASAQAQLPETPPRALLP